LGHHVVPRHTKKLYAPCCIRVSFNGANATSTANMTNKKKRFRVDDESPLRAISSPCWRFPADNVCILLTIIITDEKKTSEYRSSAILESADPFATLRPESRFSSIVRLHYTLYFKVVICFRFTKFMCTKKSRAFSK